jgi:hypothetical protein
VTTEPKQLSVRPTLWTCHRPIERYERLIGGGSSPPSDALRISAIDAFLMYQIASCLPSPPQVVDLLADATEGASTAFWLAHPALRAVAIPASAKNGRWRETFAETCTRLELDPRRVEANGEAASGAGPVLYLTGPAAAASGSGTDAVSQLLETRAGAIVLYLPAGRIGQSRELEALVSTCPAGGPVQLILMREVSPFFAASELAVVHAKREPVMARIVERLVAMHDGNFQFPDLVNAAVEGAASARDDRSGNGSGGAGTKIGATLAPAREAQRYPELLRTIRRQVEESVAAGARVIVISRGDDRLLDLSGREGWHHPADGAAAIAHLEALRAKGGQFLLIPSTAIWWLEFYADFRRHLETNYPVLACRPETCLIFDLRAGAKRQEPAAAVMPYPQMVTEIRELVTRTIPQEATILVVSKGDSQLLDLGGRRGWHFPQDENGNYAGYHPADSGSAIEQLELLRKRGAGYLVLPSMYRWWLNHYAGLADHLNRHYERLSDDARCVVFRLRKPGTNRILERVRRVMRSFGGTSTA